MATARPGATKVTAADFLAFPDDFPPHSQLVEGQVVVNEPTLRHQRIEQFLIVRLATWCDSANDRGEAFLPIDVPINEWNVFAPDVSWYSAARRPGREQRYADTVPDLAIEVRSPSTWRYDIGAKFRRYEQAGVAELWLVDTQSDSVLVYRRTVPTTPTFDLAFELNTGDTLSSPMLPGFALDVSELFDR